MEVFFMKIRKLLCILCALSVLLTLTACKSDQTSIPKGNENNTEETSDHTSTPEDTEYQIDRTPYPESTFELYGKECRVVAEGAKLSEYPEPYCSLKKDEMIKAGGKAEIRNDFAARPFYKIWLTNDQETDCAYTDAWVSRFFLLGGEPGDMVYHGITFGQTKEEVDKIADSNPNIGYSSNADKELLLKVLFNEVGDEWDNRITEEYYIYDDIGRDGLGYKLYVAFLDGKVYGMALTTHFSASLF